MRTEIERLNSRKCNFLNSLIEDFKAYLVHNLGMVSFKSVLDFDNIDIVDNIFYDYEGNSYIFVGAKLEKEEIVLIGYNQKTKELCSKSYYEYDDIQLLNVITYINRYKDK